MRLDKLPLSARRDTMVGPRAIGLTMLNQGAERRRRRKKKRMWESHSLVTVGMGWSGPCVIQ